MRVRLALLAFAVGLVPVLFPTDASAERFVGKTSQGKRIKLWTLSSGRVDFRIYYRAYCGNNTYLSDASGYPDPDRRPKLSSDNHFLYREKGKGRNALGRYTYRGQVSGVVPDEGPAHGRFSLKFRFRSNGAVCRAKGTWEARRK